MKYALITGGATRIGREIAIYLHSNGYKTIVHYCSSSNEAASLAKKIDCQLIQADLEKSEDVEKLIKECGHVDLLVNNAAIFVKDGIEGQDSLKIRHLKVNFLAPKLLIEGLSKTNPKLTTINILDAWAETEPHGFEAYYESKKRLSQLTKHAKENYKTLKVYGVKIGAILIKTTQKKEVFDKIAANHHTSMDDLMLTLTKLATGTAENGVILDIS